jgi:DNA-binding transcriptional ArsR family regulator
VAGPKPGELPPSVPSWPALLPCALHLPILTYNHMVLYNALSDSDLTGPGLTDPGLTDPELDRLFRALADTTRRDIVARVLGGEGASVSTLASRYAMSFAAVQKHVAVLEEAGLVTKHRRGRERIVRGNPERLARARELLVRLESLWRERFEQLDDLLAEPASDPDPGD